MDESIEQEHIHQPPAIDLLEPVEKDDPKEKMDRIVEHHPADLQQKGRPILHCREEVGFPEGEEK